MNKMRTYSKLYSIIIALIVSLPFTGCREEIPVLKAEGELVDENPGLSQRIKGLYLLNEGNMGSNKCTLDFYNCTNGYYLRNIYAERNPGVVKELGDVGNDLQIYRNRLYAVVNCSHFVEVMDARTATHIGTVDITNCRYIVFDGDNAYVSSYAGPVQIDPNARPGKIVEFDVNTLETKREVVVGYQPEEMVIKNGKLYVANSGGYRFPNYDRTVSVVDLNSFEVVDTIDVAINLHRMKLDRFGRIYVSSRGDYYGTGSNVYVIDTATNTVTDTLNIAAGEMCMCGDSLYITSVEWSYITNSNEIKYALYDVAKQQLVTRSFITDGTDKDIQLPYGIAVNPENREIFVTDATNYVTPGYLYCYTPDGKLKWKVRTGDIPAHFAFTTEDIQ